jgi:predicted transcriptional regulator
MKRTTISLPDELATALQREARRRRVSVSEVARQALSEHLGLDGRKRHLPFVALGRSGYSDTAERMEEILAEEWDPYSDR